MKSRWLDDMTPMPIDTSITAEIWFAGKASFRKRNAPIPVLPRWRITLR
jgi:hypothetical protein